MKSAVGFIKSDDTKQKLGSLAGKIKMPQVLLQELLRDLQKVPLTLQNPKKHLLKLHPLWRKLSLPQEE